MASKKTLIFLSFSLTQKEILILSIVNILMSSRIWESLPDEAKDSIEAEAETETETDRHTDFGTDREGKEINLWLLLLPPPPPPPLSPSSFGL